MLVGLPIYIKRYRHRSIIEPHDQLSRGTHLRLSERNEEEGEEVLKSGLGGKRFNTPQVSYSDSCRTPSDRPAGVQIPDFCVSHCADLKSGPKNKILRLHLVRTRSTMNIPSPSSPRLPAYKPICKAEEKGLSGLEDIWDRGAHLTCLCKRRVKLHSFVPEDHGAAGDLACKRLRYDLRRLTIEETIT